MHRDNLFARAWRHKRVFIVCSMLCLLTASHVLKRELSPNDSQDHFSRMSSSKFICPGEFVTARNGDDMNGYKALDLENESDFDLEQLKLASGSDGWKRNYHQRKKDKYEWKKEYFASLKNGDKIYESACGRGLNLLLTLEILKETKNLKNVVVYGNDYLDHSVKMANQVLARGLENGNKLGSVCQGDSSNLANVPSDFFDLVYTGYIDPIWDPLNITSGLGHEPSPKEICHTEDNTLHWAVKRLGELQQEATEDWFAKWVSELVRIAKPGKPIIVEEVALPICGGAPGDWGGVTKEWWKLAIDKYKWDVDLESIVTKSQNKHDKIHSRYNVFMRKNEK